MKPIKLYFAGAWSGKASPEEVALGIKNKLCSFVYPQQFKSWMEVTKGIPGSIIIDSGAFSAWSKNEVIDLEKYIEYCHEAINQAEQEQKEIHIVNIDVIPGVKGQTTTINKIHKGANVHLKNEAAKEGYKNMRRMLKRGIKPIHVFHQGEEFRWLDKMLEWVDYIGISPANDVPQKVKRQWINQVFEYLYKVNMLDKTDTHGFAVWDSTSIRTYPWTSCDAASWRLVSAWGIIYYPIGGFRTPDYAQQPMRIPVSGKSAAPGTSAFPIYLVNSLMTDGYTVEQLQTWEERCRVNIRYFLELEKWTNAFRSTRQYKPRNKLL